MAPYWLLRLNDFLACLNPALGCIATVLAVLVVQAADQRLSVNRMSPAIAMAQPMKTFSAVGCPGATLPQELRDLRLYD
jgi:hypothetical protein